MVVKRSVKAVKIEEEITRIKEWIDKLDISLHHQIKNAESTNQIQLAKNVLQIWKKDVGNIKQSWDIITENLVDKYQLNQIQLEKEKIISEQTQQNRTAIEIFPIPMWPKVLITIYNASNSRSLY